MAEFLPAHEGSMWTIAIARWSRSAGVVDCIMYEQFLSGPRRSGRVHRNGLRWGRRAREDRSAMLS
jgi:hypothetical protein